jgi:hypothetical protein
LWKCVALGRSIQAEMQMLAPKLPSAAVSQQGGCAQPAEPQRSPASECELGVSPMFGEPRRCPSEPRRSPDTLQRAGAQGRRWERPSYPGLSVVKKTGCAASIRQAPLRRKCTDTALRRRRSRSVKISARGVFRPPATTLTGQPHRGTRQCSAGGDWAQAARARRSPR